MKTMQVSTGSRHNHKQCCTLLIELHNLVLGIGQALQHIARVLQLTNALMNVLVLDTPASLLSGMAWPFCGLTLHVTRCVDSGISTPISIHV